MSNSTATPAPGAVRAGINKFFTMGTVGTFAGSVAALTLIVNILYDVMGVGSKPLTLGIALAMSVGAALYSTTETGRKLIGVVFIAFINGLLIYGTAYGVDMSVITKPVGDEAGEMAPFAEPPPSEPVPEGPEGPEPEPPPEPPPREIERPEVERERINVRQEGPFGTRKVPVERSRIDPDRLEGR